jgi:hypothetical protein
MLNFYINRAGKKLPQIWFFEAEPRLTIDGMGIYKFDALFLRTEECYAKNIGYKNTASYQGSTMKMGS